MQNLSSWLVCIKRKKGMKLSNTTLGLRSFLPGFWMAGEKRCTSNSMGSGKLKKQ